MYSSFRIYKQCYYCLRLHQDFVSVPFFIISLKQSIVYLVAVKATLSVRVELRCVPIVAGQAYTKTDMQNDTD